MRAIKDSGRYPVGDGLYLQISDSGQRSWLFRYQRNGGKRREMGLGPLRFVSLAEAREKALGQRKLLLEGKDPIDERRAQRAAQKAITFAEAADQYIAAHRAGWKNAKHAAQW